MIGWKVGGVWSTGQDTFRAAEPWVLLICKAKSGIGRAQVSWMFPVFVDKTWDLDPYCSPLKPNSLKEPRLEVARAHRYLRLVLDRVVLSSHKLRRDRSSLKPSEAMYRLLFASSVALAHAQSDDGFDETIVYMVVAGLVCVALLLGCMYQVNKQAFQRLATKANRPIGLIWCPD